MQQLKIEQFSPGILKFGIKLVVNCLIINCFSFLNCLCLYFIQACVDWILIIFGTQVIMKNWPVRLTFSDYLSVSYEYQAICNLTIWSNFANQNVYCSTNTYDHLQEFDLAIVLIRITAFLKRRVSVML